MAIQKIELIWITVSDLKKSVTFFTQTLGLSVHQLSEEFGWAEVVGKDGGCLLGIARKESDEPTHCSCCGDNKQKTPMSEQNAIVAFTVDDLDKTIAELKKAGVNFIDEILEIPEGPRMITFVDFDGNKFQLVEPCEMERKR